MSCAGFRWLSHAFSLNSPTLEASVFELEPGNHEKLLDEDYLDDIAEAFGQVVYAKVPIRQATAPGSVCTPPCCESHWRFPKRAGA